MANCSSGYTMSMTMSLYACIFLLVLCAFTQSTAAADEQIQVLEMPTQVNYNLPLTFQFNPATPIEANHVVIKLLLSPSTYSDRLTYQQCALSVQTTNGKKTAYQIDEFENNGDDDWANVNVTFENELSLSQLFFSCAEVMIHRDDSFVLGSADVVEMSIVITNEDSTFPEVLHSHSFEITHQQAIFQRYAWDNRRPGIVSVEFTFYTPKPTPGRYLYFRHPLLDPNNITSMHLPPSENIQQDLGRLYNLPFLTVTNLLCIVSENSKFGSNFILRDDGFIHLRIPTGALRPACKIIIKYPIDVIDYVFKHGNSHTIITTDESVPQMITIPFTRPVQIPVKTTLSELVSLPKPLQLWKSPHHTSDINHFEFGIAKSSSYIFENYGPFDILPSLVDFTFKLNSQYAAPDLFEQAFENIRCKSHGEVDYTNSPMSWQAFVSIVVNGHELDDVFGNTCKISLSQILIPQTNVKHDYYTISHLAYSIEEDPQIKITDFGLHLGQIDGYYQGTEVSLYRFVEHYIPDASIISSPELPPITPIPMTKGIDTTGRTVLRGSMNVQFLLPFHPSDGPTQHKPPPMAFQFVFHQCMNRNDIAPAPSGAYQSQLRITFGDDINTDHKLTVNTPRMIFNSDTHTNRFSVIDDVDPIPTIFQPNRPIRSPSANLYWETPTSIDHARPITVTVELPVNANIPTNPDGKTVDIYAVVNLTPSVWDGQYHPEYARITPVLTAPLTGYSYRCVTWDKMAAPYVYGNNEPTITNTNSKPCSDYFTDGFPVEIENANIWKKSEFINHRGFKKLSTPSCFYELAAACVTPSATHAQDGTYDVHPLADCSSFLGETHAVPCSLVEFGDVSSAPTWGYELKLHQFEANMTDDEHTIRMTWVFKGDPRLTVSIFATAHSTSTNGGENVDASNAIPIAAGIPSYLDFEVLHPTAYQLPYYDPHQVKQISITVELESHPGVGFLHIINYNPTGDSMAGCTDEFGKVIDETIHLCVCQPGLAPSVPNGLDNPFIHPEDFICEIPCPVGFSRVNGECQCNLDQDGCQHGGVCSENEGEDGHQCICVNGYYGDICQYSGIDDLDPFCDELECVIEHTFAASTNEDGEEDGNEEDLHHTCKIVVDPDDAATLIQCNCHPAYTGDRCELDNPDYIPPCDDGFEWNPKTRECEPVLPDDFVCHTFSETVLPPFFTNHCGYGVPSGANCDECSCLSRWVQDPTSDDKKCSRCKLEYGEPDEQCVKNGHTNEITYSPLLCWVGRCLCNPGYYGPKCQHKVMYGTLEFLKTILTSLSTPSPSSSSGTASVAPLTSDSTDTTTILTRAQLQELELRIVGPISDALHAYGGFDIDNPVILHIQQATQTVTIINNDSDDNNENNGEEENQVDNDPRTEQQQQIMTTVVFAIQLPINDDSKDNTDGGNDNNEGSPFIQINTLNENNESTSLYDAWEQLQETGIPEDAELGAVKSVEPIYDPHCVPNEFVTCPDGQDNLLPPEQQVDADELEDIYVEDPLIDDSDDDDDDDGIDDDDDDDDKSSNGSKSNPSIFTIIGIVLMLCVILL